MAFTAIEFFGIDLLNPAQGPLFQAAKGRAELQATMAQTAQATTGPTVQTSQRPTTARTAKPVKAIPGGFRQPTLLELSRRAAMRRK